MWVGLLGAVILELLFFRQAWRYAQAEFASGLPRPAFGALLAGGVVSAVVIWNAVKYGLGDVSAPGNDDIYAFAFGLTIAIYPPLGIALMLRRGSAVGQSVGMWLAFCTVPIGWFAATTLYYGPMFRTWQWIALGVFSTLGGFLGTCLVYADNRHGVLGGARVRLRSVPGAVSPGGFGGRTGESLDGRQRQVDEQGLQLG
jgi:hypothetical protein